MRPILNAFTITGLAVACIVTVTISLPAKASQARSVVSTAHPEHVMRREENTNRRISERTNSAQRKAMNNSRKRKEMVHDFAGRKRLGNNTNTTSSAVNISEPGSMGGARNKIVNAQQERSLYVGDFNWQASPKNIAVPGVFKTTAVPAVANTTSKNPRPEQKRDTAPNGLALDDKQRHLSVRKRMEDHRLRIDRYLTDLRRRLYDVDAWLIRKIRHDIEKCMYDMRNSQLVAMNDPALIDKWEAILNRDLFILSQDMQLLQNAHNNIAIRSGIHAARKS